MRMIALTCVAMMAAIPLTIGCIWATGAYLQLLLQYPLVFAGVSFCVWTFGLTMLGARYWSTR